MSDQPPKGALVALRDRREEVIAQLTAEFARDAFDVDELDRRLDLAHRATDLASLDALLKDLAAPAPTTALAPRPARPVDLTRYAERKRMVAIFGGVERKGGWIVPRQLTVIAMMGGAELDFREADLAPGVTEVRVTALMGGVEILVPPTLSVEVEGSAIMGGFEHVHRAPRDPDPDRPVLRISGLAMMGGVSIETRLPGESRRDARKREKREAKALRGQPRAELPAATARRRDD